MHASPSRAAYPILFFVMSCWSKMRTHEMIILCALCAICTFCHVLATVSLLLAQMYDFFLIREGLRKHVSERESLSPAPDPAK